MDVGWKRTWNRLVRQHIKNQIKIQRLHYELQRFKVKHNRIQQSIEEELQNYEYKVQLMNILRAELDNYVERNKKKLTLTKRKKIQKLREMLPGDSLATRVRQMELIETKKSTAGSQSVNVMAPLEASVSSAQVKTRTSVKRRLASIEADEQVLTRINHKTFVAMNDIRQLQFTIRYLKRTRCSKLEINPYIDSSNWLEMAAKPEPKDISATIALNCSRKTKKRKKVVTRQFLDVRPPFILRNIPELMPDRYHYLH